MPWCKSSDLGPSCAICKSEISVLFRDSVNLFGAHFRETLIKERQKRFVPQGVTICEAEEPRELRKDLEFCPDLFDGVLDVSDVVGFWVLSQIGFQFVHRHLILLPCIVDGGEIQMRSPGLDGTSN